MFIICLLLEHLWVSTAKVNIDLYLFYENVS